MVRKNDLLNRVPFEEILSMYESGMTGREIGDKLGVSSQTIYNKLKGHIRHRGGVCAQRIPSYELNKHTESVAVEPVHEPENACVMLEKCTVNLMGTIGKYVMSPSDGYVRVFVDCTSADIPSGDCIIVDLKDIPALIDELKAVCRSAKSFDFGNAMW